jgi:septal ring factor EnvC (AmiA/AmiB activator)
MLRWLLLLTCFTTLPLLAQAPPDPAELARLEAAIARVQTELTSTRNERSAVQEAVLASERQIAAMQPQIDMLNTAVAQRNAELQQLATQQQGLQQQRLQQQQLLGTYLKSAWMAGNEEYLKLVLNQQDPLQGARMLQYYNYFSSARARHIAAFNLTLAELDLVATRIEAGTLELQLQQAELAGQQAALAESQAARQQALASLDSQLANRGEELARLERDKYEIELLLEELRRSVVEIPFEDDQVAFAARKASMAWPLDGRLVNTFGTRHALGDLTWEGLTIAAAPGSDIRAVHHGRVVFADWFNTSGLLLIIDHGDGYMSLYAHNQELYRVVGAWVAGGEVIAAAGNTGGQREPGLYFEIRHNGRAENPASWLLAR